jgi:hypothetical protein
MTTRQVTLTPAEARMACLIGTERRLVALRGGLQSSTGVRPETAWQIDIEGAGAELAFAKALGWYWDGQLGGTGHHRPDVGQVHVRQTTRTTGHLLIRPRFDVPGVYALVTGSLPRYQVRGWARWPGCPAREATPDPDRPPVLMIAQADLRDLAELDRAGVG